MMHGEMGIDWRAAGGFARLATQLGDLAGAAQQATVQMRAWPFLAHRGGDWTGYNVPLYLTHPARARRQIERQMRKRRHAGHHGGIRWATEMAAHRKMVPARRWVAEGWTR